VTAELHFRKGQAKTLRNICDRLEAHGANKASIETMDTAARAAKVGQPMIVQSFAEGIADGIEQLGAARPRIVMRPPV
jgi:hypothetical protein